MCFDNIYMLLRVARVNLIGYNYTSNVTRARPRDIQTLLIMGQVDNPVKRIRDASRTEWQWTATEFPDICNMALADAMLPSINTFASNQMLDEKQSAIVRVSSAFHLNLRYRLFQLYYAAFELWVYGIGFTRFYTFLLLVNRA